MRQSTPLGSANVKSRIAHSRSPGSPDRNVELRGNRFRVAMPVANVIDEQMHDEILGVLAHVEILQQETRRTKVKASQAAADRSARESKRCVERH